MQRRESEQLGICHRLFNLIMSSIIARGFKRVTMGPTTVRSGDSVEVPLEGSSKNGPLEVAIELNHINGQENWVNFEDHGSPVQEKEGLIAHVDDDQSIKGGTDKSVTKDTGRSKEKDKMPLYDYQKSSESQAHDSRRGVSINGSKEDQKAGEKKKNENNVGTDKSKGPPRNVWHLFSVDEKSDEFIRKKKEAMRKNYTLDHPR